MPRNSPEFQVSIRLMTHCPTCGTAVVCESRFHIPHTPSLNYSVEDMKNKIRGAVCPRCRDQIPELPTEWYSDPWGYLG